MTNLLSDSAVTPAGNDSLTRFDSVFAEIAAGAAERDRNRELPYAIVERLRREGFAALRIPTADGGGGASFTEFVDLLIALGRADSNLPQLLRGHIGFTELVLADRSWQARDFWLHEIASGALIGNAQSERGSASFGAPDTRITRAGSGWSVTGRKFYSTGSIFADWIYLSGLIDEQFATAVVRADGPGVERLDDWDGFGQRLTGSGTTIFTEAPAESEHVKVFTDNDVPVNTQQAVFQLIHLATLAGIAQRVLDDAVTFVKQRRRNGFLAKVAEPRHDPQIQQVVGEISANAFAVTAATRAAAAAVESVLDAEQHSTARARDYAAADAAVFTAQDVVIDLTLRAASDLFRVGGASATSRTLALDRHWRNARTLASHNPEVLRARTVGDYLLNGIPPARLGGGRHPEPLSDHG